MNFKGSVLKRYTWEVNLICNFSMKYALNIRPHETLQYTQSVTRDLQIHISTNSLYSKSKIATWNNQRWDSIFIAIFRQLYFESKGHCTVQIYTFAQYIEQLNSTKISEKKQLKIK